MRIENQSIRQNNIEEICGALDKKCLEHDMFLNYSFLRESEYDYELPESENPYCYLAFDEEDNLIAYLGFVKLNNNNMQLCMAVDPEYRRQKLGTNLFLRLVSEFDSFSYSVSLDPENEIGKAFLEKLGFNFASREMTMGLYDEDFHFDSEPIELKIETEADNPELETENLLKVTAIIDETVENKDEPIKKEIGWLYLIKDGAIFCLCDIEIDESYREQGYGHRLLQSTIQDAFKHAEEIVLHVTSDNTPAINLYKKNGFKTLETIDIYEI